MQSLVPSSSSKPIESSSPTLRTHHVTVKYMLKIAFVACVVELFFAYDLHDNQTKMIFAVFGLVGVALYLYFYEGRRSDRPTDPSESLKP